MTQAGDEETTDSLVVNWCNNTLQYRDKLDVSFWASLRWRLRYLLYVRYFSY